MHLRLLSHVVGYNGWIVRNVVTFELCSSKALTEKTIQPCGSLFFIPAV